MNTRFNYMRSFILNSYVDNELIQHELDNLKDYLIYSEDYKEKLFDFMKHKRKLKIENYDDKTFRFIKMNSKGFYFEDDSSLFKYIVTRIVKPAINDYLNRSIFMDSFYDVYVKPYIDKMAKTVKNYTVESSSYNSIIPPFETGWVKFCSSHNFEDVIDELTLNVLYKLTKYKINVCSMTTKKCVSCNMFDLLMKSDKIISKTDANYIAFYYSDTTFKTIRKYFHEISSASISFDYERYIDRDGKTSVEFIKKIVRYVFVQLIKQMIPSYFMKKRYTDDNANSLISDIELFYTKNLSNLRSNNIYYKTQKNFCENVIKAYEEDESNKQIDSEIERIYVRDLKRILVSISHHISGEHIESFKNITKKINSEPNVLETYKEMLVILTDLYDNSEITLKNSYNFSFITRWNEIVNTNTIWNPEDYIVNSITFIKGRK